jgi:predicted Zn-ribbon and HTH transcriptional regulator
MEFLLRNEINQCLVVIPPKPNWRCKDCKHELYLSEKDETPKKCPECGSQKIWTTHIRKVNLDG